MDRSHDFKRRATYWQTCSRPAPEEAVTPAVEHNVVDRFSVISSTVFTQLQALEALISPYAVNPPSASASGASKKIGGRVVLPCVQNVMSHIQTKRALFDQVDIKDVVHDARVAGDLIGQMKASIEEEAKKWRRKPVSRNLQEHRFGVIACLQHILKAVQTAVEQYERYRLNVETSMNSALRVMRDNQMKVYRAQADGCAAGALDRPVISKDYLRLFVDDPAHLSVQVAAQSATQATAHSATQSSAHVDRDGTHALPDAASQSPAWRGTHPALHSTPSPQSHRSPSVQSHRNFNSMYHSHMDNLEPPGERDLQAMELQHRSLVDHVHEEMQASELKTISNVQQRLSEISSMFEQFSGTLAVQLDMFESINANVMESLSNIETTETSLQKANTDNMPYHQLLMCYFFVGTAVFLLLVDWLKSRSGSYIL